MDDKEIEKKIDEKISSRIPESKKGIKFLSYTFGIFLVIFAIICAFIANPILKLSGLENAISDLDVKALNEIPNLIEKQNYQTEFNQLAAHTLIFAKEIYHPNLQLDTDNIPSDAYTAIHNNLNKLKDFLSKGAKETAEYHLVMGLFYCGERSERIKDVYNAIEHFEKYIDERPYDANVLTNLGLCYQLCEEGKIDTEKARQYFMNALKFDRGYCRAHYNLALLDFDEGKENDAINRLDKVINNHPRCPEAYYAKSLILSRKGKIKEAGNLLTIAAEKGFDDISWLLRTPSYSDEFRQSDAYINAVSAIKNSRFLD